MNTKLST